MTQRLSRQVWLILGAGACLGMASAMAGCGGSTPEQDAISAASSQLYGLGVAGSSALPGGEERAKTFNNVLKSVAAATTSSNAGEAAAAQGLIARANSGLAEMSAYRLADIERAAVADIAQIRAVFDQWLSQKSVADSLRAYDPSAELTKVDDEIRTREAEAARAREAKDSQAALVAQTKAKAAQARQQAAGFRDQEAALRTSVASASQTQRAAAFEQALGIKRQGDEYEKQAGVFDAEAAAQEPEITSLDSTIQKLERQVALLRESKQAMITRANASKAQADAAAAEADEGARQVTELLAKLDERRGSLEGPHGDASKYYGAALAAARKAASPDPAGKAAANLLVGNIQQSMGDMFATKARGLGAYAALLSNLNQGGQPGVGADRVQSAREAHAAAVTAAREAYNAASQAYQNSGGSAEAKERLAKIAEAVAALAKEPEAAAPAAPADAATGEPEKSVDAKSGEGDPVEMQFDSAAVTNEVREALRQMKASSSDAATTARWIEANDPDVKSFMDAGLAVGTSKKALDEACTAKFGKDLKTLISESTSQSIKSSPVLGMLDSMSADVSQQLAALDPETVEIAADKADRATLSVPGSPMPAVMVKTADGWKLSMDAMLGEGPGKAMLGMMKAPMEAIGGAFAATTEKVNKGEYGDAEAMLLDLNRALMAGMQRAMPGGGGPGGG